MKSDFTVTPNENFTLEVVTRDIKNCTSSNMSQYYATMLGGVMDGWGMTGGTIVLMKNKGTGTIAAALSGSTYETIMTPTLNDNELNTWVWALGSGSYVDGEKIRECANTYNTARGIGLFTHYSGSYTSYYRAKGKIHAVRIYNRCLTDEEIAQNHAEDVRLYGE